MKNLIDQPLWQALSQHYHDIAQQHMRGWFTSEADRFTLFSIKHGEILLDYSRNRINKLTMRLLTDLAESIDLRAKIEALFAGHPINVTEKRPVLHTALRDHSGNPIYVNNQNISEQIAKSRKNLFRFAEAVHTGKLTGKTGKPFRHIVNIGIGGSYLGPMMCTQALHDFAVSPLHFHFISTVDPDHSRDVLEQLDAETTLFIVSSKTFTTIETITNARAALDWLQDQLGKDAVKHHFAAVTVNKDKAVEFGIDNDLIFTFWDWVGGRYSIWSAIGIPLILMIGPRQFSEFLEGAHDMDHHFRTAPFNQNIPVILGLLAIWYVNFFNTAAQAIIPYSHRLRSLVSYLQQMEMESSGKSATLTGERVSYPTGSIIFGEEGCNGQHSYHQLLHQGQHLIPVDFILIAKPHHSSAKTQHSLLLASALSQAYALMHGKTAKESEAELKQARIQDQEAEFLSRHLAIDGNKPSNLIILDRLTPKNLGALLAIYEHKIFVQGTVWNINPYDQWGVELGKKSLPDILRQMESETDQGHLDPATKELIRHFKKMEGNS